MYTYEYWITSIYPAITYVHKYVACMHTFIQKCIHTRTYMYVRSQHVCVSISSPWRHTDEPTSRLSSSLLAAKRTVSSARHFSSVKLSSPFPLTFRTISVRWNSGGGVWREGQGEMTELQKALECIYGAHKYSIMHNVIHITVCTYIRTYIHDMVYIHTYVHGSSHSTQ